ncbi:hypothetical protein [Pedobacter sp.]|jgi:hypothetical protein|uniref:hypothetical protein n=1 Tax=Pedobacter sp. TaxID=1411316 RepID=UPI002B6D647C|nr:hypothetical protein [Pedobacter sp.]HWW39647.1 hypothetical protein [Pedobacter sp.]
MYELLKTICLSIILISLFCNQAKSSESQQMDIPQTPENQAYFAAVDKDPSKPHKMPKALAKMIFGTSHVPEPHSGVHIRPMSKMNISKQGLQAFQARQSAIKKTGYVKEYNTYALTLQNIQHAADEDYKESATDTTLHNTHLVRTFNELELAYKGQDIPLSLVKSSIGYSPAGMFMDNDKYKGWSAWGLFFVSQNDLTCTYDESNVEISGGSANVAKEIVSHNINGKITTIVTSGNNASGFIVDAQWFDKRFRNQLRCRIETYDKSLVDSVIAMAKDIDKKNV